MLFSYLKRSIVLSQNMTAINNSLADPGWGAHPLRALSRKHMIFYDQNVKFSSFFQPIRVFYQKRYQKQQKQIIK